MKLNRTALRTIKILEYIANQKDGCTLLEITEALDIPCLLYTSPSPRDS